MRLPKQTVEVIRDVARTASACPRQLSVPAPTQSLAAAMFRAANDHVLEMGGAPRTRDYAWEFSNGSVIRIEVVHG